MILSNLRIITLNKLQYMAEDYCPADLSGSDGDPDASKSECNVVSRITIIYDDKFIRFIEKLKRHIDVSALALKDTFMLMPIQKDIREYIIENQSEFDLIDRKKITENNHPNIFAIMICIIIPNLREYSSFQGILDESQKYRWEIGMQSSNEPNDTGYANSYGEQNFRCACNKSCSPENMFLISNLETGMNIATGCECITKTKFIEPGDLKELEKKSKNDPHYIAIKRARHIKKMKDGLSKLNETIPSIKSKYSPIGGNFGEHKEAAELHFALKYNGEVSVSDFEVKTCDSCNERCNKNYFISEISEDFSKTDEILSVCEHCIDELDFKIKRKGICDDCGNEHKNRSDNYCNDCRRKECCDNCLMRKNIYCKGRCFECSLLNYCKICDKAPRKQGHQFCGPCYFNCAADCESCDKKIHPKFKKCWNCKNKK